MGGGGGLGGIISGIFGGGSKPKSAQYAAPAPAPEPRKQAVSGSSGSDQSAAVKAAGLAGTDKTSGKGGMVNTKNKSLMGQ